MYYCYVDTPIGELLLAGEDGALAMIGFPKGSMRRDPEADWIYNEKPLAKARQQLDEYFAGARKDFDLPLKLEGTEFQVSDLRPELAHTDLQRESLQRLAELSGGRSLSVWEIDDLPTLLDRSPHVTTVRTDRPLWDRWWVAALIILLLGG